jgi:hypothetical protein
MTLIFFFFSLNFIAFMRRAFSGVILASLVDGVIEWAMDGAMDAATDFIEAPELVAGRGGSRPSVSWGSPCIDKGKVADKGLSRVSVSPISNSSPCVLSPDLFFLDPFEKGLNPAGRAAIGRKLPAVCGLLLTSMDGRGASFTLGFP